MTPADSGDSLAKQRVHESGRTSCRRVGVGEGGLPEDDTRRGDYFWSDHEAGDELTPLRLIEEFNDPSTFRHLDAIGVAEGWRCLEVGKGAPHRR